MTTGPNLEVKRAVDPVLLSAEDRSQVLRHDSTRRPATCWLLFGEGPDEDLGTWRRAAGAGRSPSRRHEREREDAG